MDKDVEIEWNGDEDIYLYIDQKGIIVFLLQKGDGQYHFF